MKTHVAVYEEGLFDLRGAKLFKGGGGQMPPLAPLKETYTMYWYLLKLYNYM